MINDLNALTTGFARLVRLRAVKAAAAVGPKRRYGATAATALPLLSKNQSTNNSTR
jgi:hypothetical protein